MIASEFTAFTFDRTERFSCNAVQEALDSPVQTMSDFDVIIIGDSVPMLPIDCTTLISIQRMQKKQPIPLRHNATHN